MSLHWISHETIYLEWLNILRQNWYSPNCPHPIIILSCLSFFPLYLFFCRAVLLIHCLRVYEICHFLWSAIRVTTVYNARWCESPCFTLAPLLHDIYQEHTKNLYRCSVISLFPYVLHATKLLVLLLVHSSLLAVVLLLLPVPSSQHIQSVAVLVGSGTSHLWIELDLVNVRKHQLNQSVLYLKCGLLDHTGDASLHHQVLLLGFWIKDVKK